MGRTSLSAFVMFLSGLLAAWSLAVHADDRAPTAGTRAAPAPITLTVASYPGADQVLYLGDIKVTGQKVIIAVLQQVKAALDRPLDTSKEHENDIVCRISTASGSRTRQYLTCATNKQFTQMRLAAQQKYLDAFAQQGQTGMSTDMDVLAEHMSGQNQGHILHVPLDVSKFEAMMHSIPEAPTDAAPAASTASGR